MLDHKRIGLMAKLAIYEKGIGRKDIRLSRSYRSDYIRMNLLKTVFYVIVAVFVSIALYAIYDTEGMANQAAAMGYSKFAAMVVFVCIIVLIISEAATLLRCSIELKASRKRLKKYYGQLRNLRRLYQEDAVQQNGQRGGRHDKTVNFKG